MNETFLEQLLEISKRMAENRVLDPLLRYAVGIALEIVNAERGYLVLMNRDGSLDFRVKQDKNGTELKSPEEQVSRSILDRVITHNKPLVITDAMVDPAFQSAKSVSTLRLRSVMCVPLISKGTTIGVIYVENRSNANIFEEKDLTPLILFANQAAVSIENAILNDELEYRVSERTAELQYAKAQIEQSWMEAVEINRLRTLFLSNLVHDIRSPMAMVISALNLLEEGEFGTLNEDQLEWIQKSLRTSQHIIKLTEDFFDLTKLEMGRLTLHTESIELNDYLKTLHQTLQSLPWNAGVEFKLDLHSTLPTIFIDPTRIQQVIVNLLSNASKFTESGSVTLYADYVKTENNVLIGVVDTGVGIPLDQQVRIFDRFQQVSNKSERNRSGTGLGLSICKELVRLHGGEIWVESIPEKGADFKFTLPLSAEIE